MYNFFTILIIKIIQIILKLFNKQGGNLPGKIALKLNPNILKKLKINGKVIAVTATNGKTSTNNCIRYTLGKAGYTVVSNSEGNNMKTGIISTLLKSCTLTGKIKADFLCFEVDESYVPIIFKDLKLDTLVVLNFFRDQLDRNGEVETLILKINDFLKTYENNLILNGDDPNVARLGKANPNNSNVFYYHADAYENATKEMLDAGEGKFCPFCKTRLDYEYYQYSHIGKFECPNCHFGNNDFYKTATDIDLNKKVFSVDGIPYEMHNNSIYTVYNNLAVISVSSLYEIETEIVQDSLKNFALNNGRLEDLTIKSCKTIINLAKNPTGANVSLRLLNEDPENKDLLFVLNDNIADGFDVSWIWDINFNNLKNVERIITAGTRAYDIAIRIKTSGFDENKIYPYLNLTEATEKLYETTNKKYVIANYTALQPTRKEILKLK